MAATATIATTVASGGAAAAAAAGWPPSIVITCAVCGGLISAWLNRPETVTLTLRWIGGVFMHVVVSSAAGVALSTVALAMAERPGSMLGMLTGVPHWALAGVIAAGIHTAAPIALGWLSRRAAKE